MVGGRTGRLAQVLLALCGLFAAAFAQGQTIAVRASVDRETIRLNESFTYIVRAEGQVSGIFDPSALARDFEILETSRSTRVQIVNGRASQVAEWLVSLMPRRVGLFELPPVILNGVQSNAVTVEILPATAAAGAGDIFIEVELDRPTSYVQAQTIYTLKLYVGIGTGRATLTAPVVEGGEAIVEKLGDDSEYETVRGNREYFVHERRYAIFPQSAGLLSIGPAVYDALIYPSRGLQRQFRLSSDVVALEVKPAVAPPASHPSAIWLPATDVRIGETWSDDRDGFEQGIPKTRTLTVVARGVLETQLPELAPASTAGLRQYADQPSLGRELAGTGIEAWRTERFAVIAQQPGMLELPPIELPWWNVETERWEVARLPSRTIDVQPAAASAGGAGEESAAAAGAPAAPQRSDAGLWPWFSAVLAFGWLATIVLWWLRARGSRFRGLGARPKRASRASLERQIAAACRVNDARRTRDLLLDWGRLVFAADAPTSLGELASRLPKTLADAIRGVEAALYGADGREWRGEALRKALEAAPPLAGTAAGHDPDPLAPLYR